MTFSSWSFGLGSLLKVAAPDSLKGLKLVGHVLQTGRASFPGTGKNQEDEGGVGKPEDDEDGDENGDGGAEGG